MVLAVSQDAVELRGAVRGAGPRGRCETVWDSWGCRPYVREASLRVLVCCGSPKALAHEEGAGELPGAPAPPWLFSALRSESLRDTVRPENSVLAGSGGHSLTALPLSPWGPAAGTQTPPWRPGGRPGRCVLGLWAVSGPAAWLVRLVFLLPSYKKTQETLSQAGQKTSAALSTVGSAISRKLGDVR